MEAWVFAGILGNFEEAMTSYLKRVIFTSMNIVHILPVYYVLMKTYIKLKISVGRLCKRHRITLAIVCYLDGFMSDPDYPVKHAQNLKSSGTRPKYRC